MTWEQWRREAIAKLPPTMIRVPGTRHSMWADSARFHITKALENVPAGTSAKELRRILSDAYPWGERRMWPYKVWLRECSAAIRRRTTGVA